MSYCTVCGLELVGRKVETKFCATTGKKLVTTEYYCPSEDCGHSGVRHRLRYRGLLHSWGYNSHECDNCGWIGIPQWAKFSEISPHTECEVFGQD